MAAHIFLTTNEARHFTNVVGVTLPTVTSEPSLLRTGAKIWRNAGSDEPRYLIGGYSHDGKDVYTLPLSQRVQKREINIRMMS